MVDIDMFGEGKVFINRYFGYRGFPGGPSSEESTCQCRRHNLCGFDPWAQISWKRIRQLTPVFLPEKFHGQRSLTGYGPWGHKELGMAEHTHFAYTDTFLMG